MEQKKKTKKLSVGTIIRDYNKNILIGHTTFGKGWDIPKGVSEEGEHYLDTAIRELKEEFNLQFDEFEFEQLGRFEYNKEKDLFLYEVVLFDLRKQIKLKDLKCTSTFEMYGKKFSEINKYKIIHLNEIENYMYKSMIKVLKRIYK